MKFEIFIIFIIIFCLSFVYSQQCGSFMDNSTFLAIDRNTFTIQSSPKSDLIPTYFDYQGLRLSLASNGELLITEIGANLVVWKDGFSNQVCNATMNCRLIFQSNGNLVIYYDSKPTGEPWSTYTNNKAVTLLLRTSPPYLQLVDGNCQVIKYDNKPGEPRSTPVVGPTTTVAVSGKALKASAWRSAIGVNTRCSQGWSSDMVYNLSVFLGVGQVRDGLPNAAQTPDFIKMKNAGVTLAVLVKGVAAKAELAAKVQQISAFHTANPGVITAIEGFNEINNFGFTYNGVSNYESNFAGMFQAQRDLYDLVKNNTVLRNLPVFDLTGGCFANGNSLGCKNFSGRADFGNGHNYPFLGAQPVRNFNYRNELYGSVGSYETYDSASNFVITEFGYHSSNYTAPGLGEGVSLETHSTLILNYFLAAVKFGFNKAHVYTLINEEWGNYEGVQEHFGLFYNNRTTKPVARAIHFLSEILADTGGKTGSLAYTFTNLPVTADYLLFQKTNNAYVIVIWNKAPMHNFITKQDIIRSPIQVGLKLPSITTSRTFKVYDINSPTANERVALSPISTVSVKGSTGISFSFGNKAVVLTIQ